jgi:hypothetical protein
MKLELIEAIESGERVFEALDEFGHELSKTELINIIKEYDYGVGKIPTRIVACNSDDEARIRDIIGTELRERYAEV